MSLKMNRDKNQVMYSYLPGYTFDFDKSSAIAQIESIRGIQRIDLNLHLILQAIKIKLLLGVIWAVSLPIHVPTSLYCLNRKRYMPSFSQKSFGAKIGNAAGCLTTAGAMPSPKKRFVQVASEADCFN